MIKCLIIIDARCKHEDYNYYYSLSPLCKVLTVIYLNEIVVIRYTVLQQCCGYSLWYSTVLIPMLNVLYVCISTVCSACVQCTVCSVQF